MEVDEETAVAECEYECKTYYFCAPACETAFEKNPDQHVQVKVEHEYHYGQQART